MPFLFFFSHVFLGRAIRPVTSLPLPDFTSKAFSHIFLFQFSLIQNKLFLAPFQQMGKNNNLEK